LLRLQEFNSGHEVAISPLYVEGLEATEKVKDGEGVCIVRLASGNKYMVVGDFQGLFKQIRSSQSKMRR
jgi:hypothetical protein